MTERTGAVDGRRLGGRYRTEALLATGGMGEVWAARDLLLDRAVAVKVLGRALAGDSRAAERLRREARAAGRLDHPNIARVLDLGEHDGRPYLVMELLDGESLATRIDRTGQLPPAEAAGIVAAVADALEAAHQAGVVHRDVKPGNVFLTSSGEVKVLDFGIAWCVNDAALTTGELLGTAAYLAPERVLGHRATPAADIYALGVVLYELLAGHRPFAGDSEVELAMAHVNAAPPLLSEVAPSTPPNLVAACHHALAKDPTSRPPSAAELARLVRPRGAGAGAPHSLPVAGATRPFPVAGATRPLPIAGAGLAPARPLPIASAATIPTRPLGVAPPASRRPRASVPAPASRRAPAGRRPRVPARPRSRPRAARRRAGTRRRGVLVTLLLAGALLAALPTLGGGLPLLVRDRLQGPFAVLEPGGATPGTEAPGSGSAGTDPAPDPGAEPADDPGPPSFVAPGAGDSRGDQDRRSDRRDDDRDRDDDDDSSGSGRSGGGGDPGGGSSGPG